MNIQNCVNLIKISILKNKKGFIIKKTNKNINVLKSFIKIKLIKFIKIENNNIFVYINYINNKPIYKNIMNLFKPSNKKYMQLQTLKKINEKYNWIFIMSTNKGIINSIEAVKLGVGGLIIAKIWN